MFFRHSSAVWRQFPQLVPGVLVVEDVHPRADVRELIEPLYARARERLARGPESELDEIQAWRRAFAQMGLKPTQYRCAAEALLRRFRREGELPSLHPLVDLCNALSLAFALPVAVLDLAGVDSYIEVRHAEGREEHWGFGGEVEHPEPGEVIFADAAGHAHARRWTFRQSRRSIVGPETRRVLIVAEGLHATAGADVAALLQTLTEGVAPRWGAPRPSSVLTAAAPQLELSS
jgi:DNA/RNA-binding domain of Phe-tRNA-synthetase-like protein